MEKKILIFFLLFGLKGFAQTSIPGSGPISMELIARVMVNLGEISPPAYQSTYSLAFLNGASHLTDKTPPFALSDWYGYTGAPAGVQTISFNRIVGYSEAPPPSIACTATPGTAVTFYYVGTMGVGTILYADPGLTTPAVDASYSNGVVYAFINALGPTTAGKILNFGSCL